jgi:hypothetical protein
MALPIRSAFQPETLAPLPAVLQAIPAGGGRRGVYFAGKDEQGRGISAEIPRLVRHDHDLYPSNEERSAKGSREDRLGVIC